MFNNSVINKGHLVLFARILTSMKYHNVIICLNFIFSTLLLINDFSIHFYDRPLMSQISEYASYHMQVQK